MEGTATKCHTFRGLDPCAARAVSLSSYAHALTTIHLPYGETKIAFHDFDTRTSSLSLRNTIPTLISLFFSVVLRQVLCFPRYNFPLKSATFLLCTDMMAV